MSHDDTGPDILDQRQFVQHMVPVTESDLDYMFVHLLRCREVFVEARAQLHVEDFNLTTEPHYAMLWAAVTELYDLYGMYSYESLVHTIVRRLASDPNCMLPQDRETLLRADEAGIIWSILQVPPADLIPDDGRDVLRRFLRERRVVHPLRDMMMQGGGQTYVQDIHKLLSRVSQRLLEIEAIRVPPVAESMPAIGSPLPPPDRYIPTTLPFIDAYIKGQRPGDCNGILGCYGSGKTTLGAQIACVNARNEHALATRENRRPKLHLLLSYEEPESKVQKRIWANAASIKRDKLEAMVDWNLTTKDNLEAYEHHLAGQGGRESGIILSETDRWNQAREWMNGSFRLLDMSGSEKYAGAGSGWVPEMVAVCERVAGAAQAEIETITVDYAGLVCKRYMETHNISEDKLRHFLGRLGDQMRRELAEHFKSTVWLLHQFNGEQGKRNPTALLHHTDAAEAKNFAENLAVCGCLGVMDQRTGCLLMNWSKVRYYANRSASPAVLQIDGDFCRMIDVSHRYVPDSTSHGFIDPATQNNIEGRANPVGAGPSGIVRRNQAMSAAGQDLEV